MQLWEGAKYLGAADGHPLAQSATMWIGWLEMELLLGDVHSLKEKRSTIRPIVAEIRRKFSVSAAEAGHLDLHRRSVIGAAVVAADRSHVIEILDAVEHLVAYRPEIELLSAHRELRTSADE